MPRHPWKNIDFAGLGRVTLVSMTTPEQTADRPAFFVLQESPRMQVFSAALKSQGWQQVLELEATGERFELPAVRLIDFSLSETLPVKFAEVFKTASAFSFGFFERNQMRLLNESLRQGLRHFAFFDSPTEETFVRLNCLRSEWLYLLEALPQFNEWLSLDLTLIEQKLLAVLLLSPDQTIHREDLFSRVWGLSHVHFKTLDVHLFNLRKKMRPLGVVIQYLPQMGGWRLTNAANSRAEIVHPGKRCANDRDAL